MNLRVRLRGAVQTALPATPADQQRLLGALRQALLAGGITRVIPEGDRLRLESALRSFMAGLPFAAMTTRGWIEVRQPPTGLAVAYELDVTASVVVHMVVWAVTALVLLLALPWGVGVKVAIVAAMWCVEVLVPVGLGMRGIRRFLAPGDEVRWALTHAETALRRPELGAPAT